MVGEGGSLYICVVNMPMEEVLANLKKEAYRDGIKRKGDKMGMG